MGAAALNVTVDLSELRELVPKFVNTTTQEVRAELQRQAALMVRDNSDNGLLEVTPPPKGQQQGADTVMADIYKVYVSKAALMKAVGAVGERGAKAALTRYFKDNDLQSAQEYLNGQKSGSVQVKGYTTKRNGKTINVRPYSMTRQVSRLNIPRLGQIKEISASVNESYHKQRRSKAGQDIGRVRSPMWWQVVLNKPPLKNYVEKKQKRVGLLKAAWAKAAQQANLRLNIPQWIRSSIGQAQGKGQSSLGDPKNMSITLTNAFNAASLKINRGNINYLIRLRQENIEKELNYRMNAAAKQL